MRFVEQTFRRAFFTRSTLAPQATASGTEVSVQTSTRSWLLTPETDVAALGEVAAIAVDAFQDDSPGATRRRRELVREISAHLRPCAGHAHATWRTPREAPQFRAASGVLGNRPAELVAFHGCAVSMLPPDLAVLAMLTDAAALTVADRPGLVVALVAEGDDEEFAVWDGVKVPVVVRTRGAPDWRPTEGRVSTDDRDERGPYVLITTPMGTSLLTYQLATTLDADELREAGYRLMIPRVWGGPTAEAVEMACVDATMVWDAGRSRSSPSYEFMLRATTYSYPTRAGMSAAPVAAVVRLHPGTVAAEIMPSYAFR